ncbi:nucleotidyltransferase domain-containing protein [Bacillus infantis]|uniref:nucleotidyltransferase domain-containing protein n=1 Tax=Bacillus infantis TaxID=324767 RepID=UPI003CFA2D88
MFRECRKAAGWMAGFEKPWFVAGGWAIDLFIGKQTRPHADLEIGIFREDQQALKSYLEDWEF